jgi:hypothetical protein
MTVPRETDRTKNQREEDTIMPSISWLAVTVATVASFVIGALWYSPLLFAGAWQRESGVTDERAATGNMPLIFGAAFALMFFAALVFAIFLGPAPGLAFGASAGFAAGLFWVAGSFGVNYLFERRSVKLWLINGGYNVVAFTTIGAIIGAMS